MAKKKLTKAEKVAQVPAEQIGKLRGEAGRAQLINYVRTMRMGYNRRVAAFKRKGLVSHAQITLENSLPNKRRRMSLDKLSRNQLILEFIRYQRFFNSETATEKGIRRINREQDIRIFGTDLSGRKPAGEMTQDERIRYWSYYDEFKNQYPNLIARYGSERIQETLASQIAIDETGKMLDVINNVKYIMEIFSKEPQPEEAPNVYSGRGPGQSG